MKRIIPISFEKDRREEESGGFKERTVAFSQSASGLYNLLGETAEIVVYDKVYARYLAELGRETVEILVEDKEPDVFIAFLHDLGVSFQKCEPSFS